MMCVLQEHSAEICAFQQHFADLFDSIQNIPTVSARLFSVRLLTNATREDICSFPTRREQVNCLLGAVYRCITLDPQNFYKFVEALEMDLPMQHLCGKLRDTCGKQGNITVRDAINVCILCIGRFKTGIPEAVSLSPPSGMSMHKI